MSRSLESTQNSTLNQFQHASRGNQHDKLSQYLQLSGEKRKAWLEKNTKSMSAPMIGGFTLEKLIEIEANIKAQNEATRRMLDESIQNKNRHVMLNNALDIFGIHDIYNASTMSILNKQEFELIDYDNIKISMTPGRCLSSSIKISMVVSLLKPFYTKSENFDIDGSTMLDHKWVDTDIKFTAKYGDLATFRRSLLPHLSKIVEDYDVEDTNERVLSEDIWDFNF